MILSACESVSVFKKKKIVDCMFRDTSLRTLAVVSGPVDEDEQIFFGKHCLICRLITVLSV